MAGLFDLPKVRSTSDRDSKLINKSNNSMAVKTITIKGSGSLTDRIASIVSHVNAKFKDKKDEFLLIRTEEDFTAYIDKCVENKIISIDTETTGLDPIEDHIVGLCIYTPGLKAAYVPVNHISYITQAPVNNQLPVSFLRTQLERINTEKVRTIWFNAPFDVRFIKHTIGVMLNIYWDASIASRILNSAEPRGARGLKPLHKKYCRNNEGEAFSFDKLFDGIPFDLIPVNTAYLYAANDAVITYELYKYQQYFLDPLCEGYTKYDMSGPSNCFFNVEMASMPAFIEMEENGITIDTEYAETISKKYHAMADEAKLRADEVLLRYSDEIDDYRRRTLDCKLSDPVNLDSPTQLAILLYDVLKIPAVDPKSPRGTGVDILERIDHPIVSAIMDNRFFSKQLSTYVDKLPTLVHADGRVHCKFNQYGADCITGESLLLTDKGYMPIKDLFDGTEVNGEFYDCGITIHNRYLKPEKAGAKIVFYDTDTYKITLKGGYSVEGTPNHPIICSSCNSNTLKHHTDSLADTLDFRKLEDIRKGDIVAIPWCYCKFPTEYVNNIDENTAHFLGIITAYATYDEETRNLTINYEDYMLSDIEQCLNNLKDIAYTVNTSYHTIHIQIYSIPLSDYVYNYITNNYDITDIMKSPINVVSHFINGFKNPMLPIIKCKTKSMYRFMLESLINIGVIASGDIDTLTIDTSKNPSIYSDAEYIYVCVENIEKSVNTVYDLNVPGTHSFIANGMINHNTGRTSSNDPNLQNIPSTPYKMSTGEKIDAGHDVRQFFAAAKDHVLLSCDYSGQEVRVTAHLSQDEKMIQAYVDGKDVYVEIASLAFGVPYEDCLECFPDGTTNPEGKARRGASKRIVLGILYGRQIKSIAEQLGVTTQEAQVIYDKVLDSFPGLAQFIQESQDMARKYGYVVTAWGRRRQLPEMQLPLYEFSYIDGKPPTFDPLADDIEDDEFPLELIEEYTNMLLRCRGYKQKLAALDNLKAMGISVKDNTKQITDAERQCVNARVQGSAADLTKLAMIELYNNQELRDLGFKMLIPVHDEIIAECPKDNAKRCAELMSELMLSAGKDMCVPLKCDTDAFFRWYGDKLDIETLLPLGE